MPQIRWRLVGPDGSKPTVRPALVCENEPVATARSSALERWPAAFSDLLVLRNNRLLRQGGGVTPKHLLELETVGFGVAAVIGSLAGRPGADFGAFYRPAFGAAALIHLTRVAIYLFSRRAIRRPGRP